MIKKTKFLANMDVHSLSIFKHIGLSSIYKAGSILIGLILVPLSIHYLGNAQYGLWLTIFSFLGWFNIVDFGIGNGLRNKLAEAFANKNIELAKGYLSTAYISMAFISMVISIIFIIIFPMVDWHTVFNFDVNDKSTNQLIFISFMMFAINLSLKNINVLFYADQKSSLPELFSFLAQLLTLMGVYIAMQLTKESLFLYGITILGVQMIVVLLSTLISFFGKYNHICPTISHFNISYIKDILNVGGHFFIIQISVLLMYATDNFVINYVLGATEVTVYNIAYKYFMLAITIMTIISTPYWSAFTSAYSQNDDLWIEKSVKTLFNISIIVSLITLIMVLMANQVYIVWVGDLVNVPFLLTLLMGLTAIVRIIVYPLVMLINGVGKIKIQFYLGFILAMINIPLSIFLAKNTNLGVSGVVLATLSVVLVELIIYPIQVKKILTKNAHGIWNR